MRWVPPLSHLTLGHRCRQGWRSPSAFVLRSRMPRQAPGPFCSLLWQLQITASWDASSGLQFLPTEKDRRPCRNWKEAEYGNEEEEQAGGRKMDMKVHCQGRCEWSRDLPMPAWRQQCSGPSEVTSDSAGIREDWGPSLSSSISGLQSNSLPTPSRLHPGSMTLHWPCDCARSSDPRPREGWGALAFSSDHGQHPQVQQRTPGSTCPEISQHWLTSTQRPS